MNPHVSKMHSIFWGVSDGGTWEARFPKERGRKRLEREMHRLIREKWKLFGGDGGSSFIGGLAFKEMRTKSGPPTNSREGEKSWHGKWALWEPRQLSGSAWSGQSLCLGLGGASFSCPMRVSPQAGGQPHLTLTLDCKQPGVLLAVLLAAESSAHI